MAAARTEFLFSEQAGSVRLERRLNLYLGLPREYETRSGSYMEVGLALPGTTRSNSPTLSLTIATL